MMKQQLTAAVLCTVALSSHAIESDWDRSGGGLWFDPVSWSAGVPGNAGDTASFGPDAPSGFAFINLGGNEATLQRLRFDTPATVFLNAGALRFDSVDNAAAELVSAQGTHTALTGIVLEQALLANIAQGVVSLGGSIQGTGDLIKTGSGELRLTGTTANWGGTLRVQDGQVLANSSSALPAGLGVQITGGALTVANDASANILVNGGTLSLNTGLNNSLDGDVTLQSGLLTNASQSTLNGTLLLPAGSTGTVQTVAPLLFAGGTVGPGALTFSAGTSRLTSNATHSGPTVIDAATLTLDGGSLANANGTIQVRPTGTLILDRPAGTNPALHSVRPGSVRLDNASLRIAADFNPLASIGEVVSDSQLVIGIPTLSAAGLMDFNTVPGGEQLRLISSGNTTIGSSVMLLPHTADNTLKLGGSAGTLTIDSVIADRSPAQPTSVYIATAGNVQLTANNTYTGDTVFDGGTRRLSDFSVFGTPTSEGGGALRFVNSTLVVEENAVVGTEKKLILENSTLRTIDDDFLLDPAEVRAPIELIGHSVIQTRFDGLTVTGPVSGPGGLTIGLAGEDTYIEFRGEQTYEGETLILGDNVGILSPTALGTTDAGTVIQGQLALFGGGGEEEIDVFGKLLLVSNENAYGHHITLHNSAILDVGNSNRSSTSLTELITDLHYVGGATLGDANSPDSELRLSGEVNGTGSLRFNSRSRLSPLNDGGFVFNAPSDLLGHFHIQQGDVLINAPITTRGDFILENNNTSQRSAGLAFLTLGAKEVVGPQSRVRLGSNTSRGRLIVEQNNTLGRLILDSRQMPGLSSATNPTGRSTVQIVPGATLTVDEFIWLGGAVDGAIQIDPIATKYSPAYGILQNPSASSFSSVIVDDGLLIVEGPSDADSPTLILGPGSAASVFIGQDGYAGEVDLNNRQGAIDNGALLMDSFFFSNFQQIRPDSGLSGGLFLGDDGAVVQSAFVTGMIHGGSLGVTRQLAIASGGHTYTGVTRVQGQEGLWLLADAHLATTSAIQLSPRSTLYFDTTGKQGEIDYLADSVPVISYGGHIELMDQPRADVLGPVSETIGTLRLVQGKTDVFVDGERTLVFNKIEAAPTSSLYLLGRDNLSVPSFRFATLPTLNDGVLGGWATIASSNGVDLASVSPTGEIVPFAEQFGYVTAINSAAPTESVEVPVGQTLASDREINALKLRTDRFDLGGHTLTLDTGAVISNRANIDNGEITSNQPAVFLISTSRDGLEVTADLVDHPDHAVGVTIDGNITLGGANTFSGPLSIVADNTTLSAASALPDGIDLNVFGGGTLIVDFPTPEPLFFDEILMDKGGIRDLDGNDLKLSFNRMTITDFVELVPLVGDGEIVIDTIGEFGTGNHPGFNGTVHVRGGNVRGSFGTPDPENPLIRPSVVVERDGVIAGSDFSWLQLRGGAVVGDASGKIEVVGAGQVIESQLTADFSGSGELTFSTRGDSGRRPTLTFDGSLAEFSGPLRLTGNEIGLIASQPAYRGDVTVEAHQVTTSAAVAFGQGEVRVVRDGGIRLGTNLSADLVYDLGTLRMENHALSGSLRIDREIRFERIGGRINSTLTLADGALMQFMQEGIVFASGPIELLGHVELQFFDRNNLFIIEATLTAGAANSGLNLIGDINNFRLFSSLIIPEGNTLTFRENDQLSTLILNRSDQELTGSGELAGGVEIGQGARLAPGVGEAALTVTQSLVFNAGGVLQIKIAGALSNEYASLSVLGDATIDPLAVLSIELTDEYTPMPEDRFTIASAQSWTGRFGEDTATVLAGDYLFDLVYTDNTIELANPRLIPEPTSLVLLSIGAGLAALRRRR